MSANFLQRFVGLFCVNNLMENSRRGRSPYDLTLPASRQVIKCFLSKLWLGVRMPQSQPTEIKHRTLGSWGGTAWGSCVDFFRETIGPRCPQRVWMETPGCGASEIAKPGPGGPSGVRPSPRPQPRQPRALGSWLGVRGGGDGFRRLSSQPGVVSPSGSKARRPPITAPARPLPRPPPRPVGGWAGPSAPLRAVLLGVRPPQPGPSGRREAGGRGGAEGEGEPSHCPEAAPPRHKHCLMWWLRRPGRRPGGLLRTAGHAPGSQLSGSRPRPVD